uniref:Uncharacterized protein n=1 Tax=Arundo donax TaxID=35708 RepID=A0A0A9F5P2_ARUDO
MEMHLSYVLTGVDVMHRPAAAAVKPSGRTATTATTSSNPRTARFVWHRISRIAAPVVSHGEWCARRS